MPPYSIFPLGDSAITVHFGNIISEEINQKVVLFAAAMEKAHVVGIKDIVPAYSSVTIHYDVVMVSMYSKRSPFSVMSDLVNQILSEPMETVTESNRRFNIPVCYSLKWALDLETLSCQLMLSVDEIIAVHTGQTYKVYMIGFLPGFAYMGRVDERIAAPRKTEPRQKIEAGSVGIAGNQTGIYPLTSPGGWQIIGKTPVKLFDITKQDPVLFKAGDEVSFYSITEDEFENY